MWPFKKEEVQKEEPELITEKPKKFARITFTVEDGLTDIEIDWKCDDSYNEDVAIDFGLLLSDLNAGKYSPEIVEIFQEYIENNSEGKKFIENVVLVWKENNDSIMKNHIDDDEPLIHPLKVFRQSSIFRE